MEYLTEVQKFDESNKIFFNSYLALERVVILQHVKEISIVNLQQHSSDLSSKIWIHSGDEWEESLTQHLLLFLWRSSSQHGGSQWLLSWDLDSLLRHGSCNNGLTLHHLAWWVPGGLGILE